MEDVYTLSIIFGFSAFICAGVYKLIKLKLSQDKGIEGEAFNRLAKAFMEHKKEMQERVRSLEAIISDEDDTEHFAEIEAPKNEDTLTNDLEQKKKIRS